MNYRMKHCLGQHQILQETTSCLKHSPFSSLLMAFCSKYCLFWPRAFSVSGRQGRLGCWGEGRLMPQGAVLNQQVLVAANSPTSSPPGGNHSELSENLSECGLGLRSPVSTATACSWPCPLCPAIPLFQMLPGSPLAWLWDAATSVRGSITNSIASKSRATCQPSFPGPGNK